MGASDYCGWRLKMRTLNELAELRRLVQQAEKQIEAHLELIEGLIRLGIPAQIAEEALRVTRRLASELHGRLKILTAS